MALSSGVVAMLAEVGVHGPLVVGRLGGGSINQVSVLEGRDGARVVLKANAGAPRDLFAREAEGLRLLHGVAGGPRVPEPLAWTSECLVLEYLEPAPRAATAWVDFGAALATLHAQTGSTFGGVADNYIGATPQSNTATADGHRFFAEQRLGPQLAWARAAGLLNDQDARAGERLTLRLKDLIPTQPAGIIHGDLWSGNVVAGPGGALCLIDPAAHYGWAEADLAMTALFGGFPESFYAAYATARPLEAGWRERFPIYNLYHLLNHLNLFGAGYLSDVRAILQRYR